MLVKNIDVNYKTQYEVLLRDQRWKIKRDVILNRDYYKCRNCSSAINLQVHHRLYMIMKQQGSFVSPWNYKNEYLVTLCASCHSEGHRKFKVKIFSI